jgi:uncharacterized protein (DUF488 family)
MAAGVTTLPLYTIGHGAVTLEEFLEYVRAAGIASVVDVRRFPGSRRHPQFSSTVLAQALRDAGIAYRHAPDLGGRRPARKDSPNAGLRNAGFRGYADWMLGEEFRAAFAALMDEASQAPTAVMCAETPWWKCHRRLIADGAELLAKRDVVHVMGRKTLPHSPTPGVAVEDDHLFYR